MSRRTSRIACCLTALLACMPAAGWTQAAPLRINGKGVSGDYRINTPGVYEIAGEAQDFQLQVLAPEGGRVMLTLCDARLNCERGAAVYVQSGDVTIDLREGNSCLSGGSEAEPAALYAMDDLVICGDAALEIDGTYRNGVECRDELLITSGKLAVTAVWDGIRGRDQLSILNGEIHVDAQNDGLKANNDKDPGLGNILISGGDIRISALDDALHAEGKAEVTGGTLTIERCFEGIEGSSVEIAGGSIDIRAEDDGVNSTGELEDVRILGGDIRIASLGDGIDSAGAIVFEGGRLVVSGTTSQRNSALDYMESSRAQGTTLFASGSAAMAQAPKSEGDRCTLRVFFDVMQSRREAISVLDEQGNLLFSYLPANDYQAVVVAHPLLVQGKRICVYQGGSVEGLQPGCVAEKGTLQGARKLCEAALDDALVSIDERGVPCDFVANSLGW